MIKNKNKNNNNNNNNDNDNDNDNEDDDVFNPRSKSLKGGLPECRGQVVILAAVVHLVHCYVIFLFLG